jgi:hypothetical protein
MDIGGNMTGSALSNGYLVIYIWFMNGSVPPEERKIHAAVKVTNGESLGQIRTNLINAWNKCVDGCGPAMSSVGTSGFKVESVPNGTAPMLLAVSGSGTEVEVKIDGDAIQTPVSGLAVARTS